MPVRDFPFASSYSSFHIIYAKTSLSHYFQSASNPPPFLSNNLTPPVLYSYTPEIFPTKDRGTGNALTASSNRIFGIMAPIIAMFANLETATPVYISGALFIVAGLLVLALPFESRGKASL